MGSPLLAAAGLEKTALLQVALQCLSWPVAPSLQNLLFAWVVVLCPIALLLARSVLRFLPGFMRSCANLLEEGGERDARVLKAVSLLGHKRRCPHHVMAALLVHARRGISCSCSYHPMQHPHLCPFPYPPCHPSALVALLHCVQVFMCLSGIFKCLRRWLARDLPTLLR